MGQPPPGWYPDPSGNGGSRYWTGQQWTVAAPVSSVVRPGRRLPSWLIVVAFMGGVAGLYWYGARVSADQKHPAGHSTESAGGDKAAAMEDALHANGITVKDRKDADILGAAVCVFLGQDGTTRSEAVSQMVDWRPTLSRDDARAIIADAIAIYCPDKG